MRLHRKWSKEELENRLRGEERAEVKMRLVAESTERELTCGRALSEERVCERLVVEEGREAATASWSPKRL